MESLWSELETYADSGIYPMHMPGHKRNKEMFPERNPYEIDITEIDGFDDLQESKGILKRVKERAARLYNADESYLLVNGSTVGILTGISAGIRKGESILMARNCHKSVYNAVFLKEAKPVYLYPSYLEEYSMYGSVSPEAVRDKLKEHPDIKMVVLVSPTYEGVVSDIASIAKEVHKKGIPLFVDEAHGAHLGFYHGFPKSSITQGADLVVQSVHKTLSGFTQSALLHRIGKRMDSLQIQKYLNFYQSSSPSYLLMSSIDRSLLLLEDGAKGVMENYKKKLDYFYKKAKVLRHLQLFYPRGEKQKEFGIYDWDCSKFIIYTKNTDLTGIDLCDRLLKGYKIQMEMASRDYALGMSSICDTWEGFSHLLYALKEIDQNCINGNASKSRIKVYKQELADQKYLPSQTEYMEGDYVNLEESEGKVSLEYLYIYPPGCPFLVPGEKISANCIKQIQRYQESGLMVRGLDTRNRIRIAKEKSEMHDIYVIMGKSASGKDTLFHALSQKEELRLRTIIPYTTRPIREGEKEGIEYHFVSEQQKLELMKQGKVIEHRVYKTIHGNWSYFTVDDGQFNLEYSNYLLIGTLEAYLDIQAYFDSVYAQNGHVQGGHVYPIYLEVEDGIRLQRALQREMQQKEPKYEEMCRRFLSDSQDFLEEKLEQAGIKKRYNSEDRNLCLQEIIKDLFC